MRQPIEIDSTGRQAFFKGRPLELFDIVYLAVPNKEGEDRIYYPCDKLFGLVLHPGTKHEGELNADRKMVVY